MEHIKRKRQGDTPEPSRARPGNGCWIVKAATDEADAYDLFHIAPTPAKALTAKQAARALRKRKFDHFKRLDREARGTKDQCQARMATAYARWLCERDGVEIPSDYRAKVTLEMDSADIPGATWSQCKRVRAVCWGYSEQVRAGMHKRRQQWVTNHVELLRVEIPHWDFVPVMTETTDGETSRPFVSLQMTDRVAA